MKIKNAGRGRSKSQHDRGYKRLFSHPGAVAELIRGFLKESWTAGLDFSTLERVGDGFIADDLRARHSDVIWRLRFRDGGASEWFYLYVLLEFQSTPYHFMAVRMLTYTGLLFEEIIRREALKPGDRLPPVLPLVIYNGRRPWRGPRDLGELYRPVPPELRRRLPDLSYVLLDEARLDLRAPDLEGNRIATLFRIETCTDPREMARLLARLHDAAPEEEDPELRRTLGVWVRSVLRRTFPGATMGPLADTEGLAMLEENMRIWERKVRRESRREGRAEGRAEGQLHGMRTLLLQQMTLRFGRLPLRVRRRVEEISSSRELRRLARRVLVAGSLDEMDLG